MSKIARANISEDKSLILLLFNSLIISYDNLNDKNLDHGMRQSGVRMYPRMLKIGSFFFSPEEEVKRFHAVRFGCRNSITVITDLGNEEV